MCIYVYIYIYKHAAIDCNESITPMPRASCQFRFPCSPTYPVCGFLNMHIRVYNLNCPRQQKCLAAIVLIFSFIFGLIYDEDNLILGRATSMQCRIIEISKTLLSHVFAPKGPPIMAIVYSDNGVAPNRHQAITWTNVGQVRWCL